MGTVYRARHVTLGRPLALKVLRADLAEEAELGDRFLQEAQATAAIKHPNVVSITDFGRLPDKRPYFVMELLGGRTLASFMKAGGALPPRVAAHVAMEIASGLEAAHQAGVIHRDLKPENVFLVGPSGDETKSLRVVDFGAAIVLGRSRLTKKGIVFGTPYYMSPEQAAGRDVDHRTDIYALGIILYEMVTGRVPFEGETYMGVLTQHMFVAPTPPSQLEPKLVGRLGPLEGIILRSLEKDAAARFASMQELSEAIASAMDHIGSHGPSWPSPPSPSQRPPRGIADELELPTLAELRGSVERVAAPKKSSPVQRIALFAGVVVLLVAVGLIIASVLGRSSHPRVEAAVSTAVSTTTATASSASTASVTATATASATLTATVAASETVASRPTSPPPEPSHPTVVRPKPTHTSSGTGLGPDPFLKP